MVFCNEFDGYTVVYSEKFKKYNVRLIRATNQEKIKMTNIKNFFEEWNSVKNSWTLCVLFYKFP